MPTGPEGNFKGEKEARPKAWLEYGLGGHEKEYIFSVEEATSREFIFDEIERSVQAELGKNWDVANRGTRIEVICKNPFGAREDERVRSAFEKALGQLEEQYTFLPS